MSTMTLSQASEERRALEARLTAAIDAEVERFAQAFGLTPQSIDVVMVDRTTTSDRRRRYMVGTVNVDLGRI